MSNNILGSTMLKPVLLSCMVALSSLAPANAAPGRPSDVLRHFHTVLLDTMKSGVALGAKGRYENLEPVVLRSFDIRFMTRIAIGPIWGKLSHDEKERAWKAFARYITASYASEFTNYEGERFDVISEEIVKHGTVVRTRILNPNGDAIAINYVLHDNDTAWQIRDVYLAGTISELAIRRSEFISALRIGGIEALISRLNEKANYLRE